jgi:hypothetical protein
MCAVAGFSLSREDDLPLLILFSRSGFAVRVRLLLVDPRFPWRQVKGIYLHSSSGSTHSLSMASRAPARRGSVVADRRAACGRLRGPSAEGLSRTASFPRR